MTRHDLVTRITQLERELRGERMLRRGWEQDARRLIEHNKRLRAELEALRGRQVAA